MSTRASTGLGLGLGLSLSGGARSGARGLPAPTSLTVTVNEDGTLSYSHDDVDGAAGYQYQTDGGAWVDVGLATSGSNIQFP